MTKKLETIDMSPAAVSGRLEVMRALFKLMLALREVKILGPALPGATSTEPGRHGS